MTLEEEHADAELRLRELLLSDYPFDEDSHFSEIAEAFKHVRETEPVNQKLA